MKHSDLYLLFCNIWIVGSLAAEGFLERILLIIMGIVWLIGYLVAHKHEKKLEEERISNPQKTIGDFGQHDNKRYFIKDGKLVDREERIVDGYQEVKMK